MCVLFFLFLIPLPISPSLAPPLSPHLIKPALPQSQQEKGAALEKEHLARIQAQDEELSGLRQQLVRPGMYWL